MRLWNEYEGTTIAGLFPIEKLIRPEGRSAFFSTSNGTGTPAVLRLIEAINDEAEILNRWKAVAALDQHHLIKLKKFGQTTYLDTPLIYVLMEATEADLTDILRERPLTPDETRQIATSLVDALEALHASGIVHEHVEPGSVMATAGDVVKLRSDCIREAPEGDEGIALKKQDVHDLAIVLLQALTQQKSLNHLGANRLPAPFDQIIRNGISGTWGLAQIGAALSPPAPIVTQPRAPLVPVQATAQDTVLAAPVQSPVQPKQLPLAMPEPPATARAAKIPAAAPHQKRVTVPLEDDPTRRRMWLAIAPAVIVIASALGWHALHRTPSANDASQPVTTLAEPSAPAATAPGNTPAPVAPHNSVTVNPPSQGDAAHRWRVVAYTYNRRDQAQHKVETIAQQDATLRPEVFNPQGRGSFLVTLGGAMTRDEALAFRLKAQGEGLPRDIYIQNYEQRHQR